MITCSTNLLWLFKLSQKSVWIWQHINRITFRNC